MQWNKLGLGALLALGASVCALGQQSTLNKVVFQNAGGFQQADLEAVAGIHGGEKVTLQQMQQAAQHLIDTGFFDDVHVDSKGGPSGLTLVYILKPLPEDQITKVAFDNFVWLTPEEMRGIVHKVVPLFNGELPESGTSLEQIDAALQAALVQKGVANAVVTHEAVMATSAQPVHTLEFRVDRPAVVVNSVRLEGVDAAFAPEVQKIATKLRRTGYMEGDGSSSTLGRILEPYRDGGYLKARVEDVHLGLTNVSPNLVGVDVTGKVDAGAVYHVKDISIGETALVSTVAFAAEAKLHDGDVASRRQLLMTLATVDAAYEKQGYADAYVDTGAQVDEAAHTVSYNLKVVPGEQYRLQSVNVVGLTPEAKAQFDLGWRLQPGDLYDVGYVRNFLANNTALRGLAGYAGGFKAESDPQTHRVNLTVNFVAVAGKG